MGKLFVATLTCSLYWFISIAQTTSNPGLGDSLFPVTGSYYQYVSSGEATSYSYYNFGIIKNGGKYLVNGETQYWADNNGSALLIDTTSNHIINNRKWRINGDVKSAIPDGQGGFFIGGNFTSIGDSSRNYIAQITATGKPTSWKPITNGPVNVILKRNDTLLIAGAFTTFGGSSRTCFAMCRTTGALLYGGGASGFLGCYEINALLLNKDTIIYGGSVQNGTENIRKYSFRNYAALSWATPFTDYSVVKHLALSGNGNVIVYAGNFNSDFIKGVSNGTGNELYYYNTSLGSSTGRINGLKTLGNRLFVYGDFVNQQNASSSSSLRGIFSFDGTTGVGYPDDLHLNGFVSFLQIQGKRIFLSGKFTSVNNVARDQFAALDTGTYNVSNWQLSISDPLTALAFDNNTAFIAGSFTGLNAGRRPGFAAIDASSHALTGWGASYPNMQGCRRMFVKGDSLFVLAVVANYSGCMIQSETRFKIYSLSTGAEYGTGGAPPGNMNDMLLDGNYLYVSHGVSLRRYLLPGLIFDGSWGMSWQFTGYSHSLFALFADSAKIYGVGDSRYTTCASTLDPKRGFVDVYNKSTGVVINYYPFEGASNEYDVILFSNAELCNNKMYIQGQFKQLNGIDRKNFACVNVVTGAITNWKPTFPVITDMYSFSTTSAIKQYDGKIWFGAGPQTMNDGNNFYGFGAIDTSTGMLSQPLKTRLKSNNYNYGGYVSDFIISGTEIALVGSFDSVNARPYENFAVFPLTGTNTVSFCIGSGNSFTSNVSGTTYQWQMDSGSGFNNITGNANLSGTQTAILQLINIPGSWYGYKFRCKADNTYSDIFEIKFKNSWTGAMNNSWENPGNWSCAMVPDANTDVIISSGTVLLTSPATIHSLSLDPGVTFTVDPAATLTILH